MNVKLHHLTDYATYHLTHKACKPEYASKMGFYPATVDECLKVKPQNRTIRMIPYRTKNTMTVKYLLRYSTSPIGVSSYEAEHIEWLSKRLKGSLPTIEEIEAELKDIR